MNFLKKMHKLFLILCLVIVGTKAGFAAVIEDVQQGYWAGEAILDCVNRGYLKLDSSYKFYPEGSIKRAEFLNSLLKVLESYDITKDAKAYFKDVDSDIPFVNDIAISQRLGMVFGYPDKTFKPNGHITHSEAISVIANISKTEIGDTSILEQFADAGDIPKWAVNSYAKAAEQNLFINHPNSNRLNPKSKMTRAEAAVLFAKMSKDIDTLKIRYTKKEKVKDILLSNENLNIYGRAPKDTVKIYNTKKIIDAGNVIVANPVEKIDTRTVKNGSTLEFIAPYNLYSTQGTLLYNEGTKFSAKVHQVKNRLWINKQNKALFIFDHAYFTDGADKEMAAVAYTTDRGNVVVVNNAKSKKVSKKNNKEITKGDMLLKYVDKLIPVVKTRIKPTDSIYLLLTGDLIIPNASL